MVIEARKIIHSKTNDGDFAKQYFHLVVGENMDTALVVKRLTLLEKDFDLYESGGHILLKKYKNKRLYIKHFGLKLSTLQEVVDWLSKF